MDEMPRMYTDIALWWPLLSLPADYQEEAALYTSTLLAACPDARTMLELGSGGGNNASWLKKTFTPTLVDASPEMLAVSRSQNPECEHLEGDMRTVRLGRLFDVVFIHDAVMYMETAEDLRLAIETAAAHTRPGGAVLLVPDCVRETFAPYTKNGGHDGLDRAMRYLEWVWDPDPMDESFLADFAYLLREPGGACRVVQDRHIMGLFPRDTWLTLLAASGFDAREVPYSYSDGSKSLGFVGIRSL